ncbi:MAG TPA: GNAT family N-acetyltransferase [Anaerolineales bacterium]|nr:GNAT family N-acetyltransferase [Anaerolineales bacterium]
MDTNLDLEIVQASQLTPDLRAAIYALCNRAYEAELEPLFNTFENATHVIGFLGTTPVSHAMWVPRWLQAGEHLRLHTAYIEMVATETQFQRRGFAARVMRRLASAITDFEIGGLCPAEPELYAKLGWDYWRGPLFIRTQAGLLPTPEEKIMILRLPKTPVLDLDLPLSAEWRRGELW